MVNGKAKIVKHEKLFGRITKEKGYASCEFVYPRSLFSEEKGYAYYSVDLFTNESEEEIIQRLHRAMTDSNETTEFETNGFSSVYDTLKELCEDCEMSYDEITEAMNWK